MARIKKKERDRGRRKKSEKKSTEVHHG